MTLSAISVYAHSTQIAYCTAPNGDIRLYMEHWHGNLTAAQVNGTLIDLTVTSGGVTNSYSTSATNFINNNTPISALPCMPGASMTVLSACPGTANAYNEWIYFDFPTPGCDEPLTVTVNSISGLNTWYFVEACAQLIPSTFTETFIDVSGPTLVCPPDENYDCVGDVPPNSITTLPLYYAAGGQASDGCDVTDFAYMGETQAGGIATGSGQIGCPGNPIVLTRTYELEDSKGNSSSCTVDIFVEDSAPPSFMNCPNDLTTTCDASSTPPYASYGDFQFEGGSASDVCAIDPASFTFVSDVSDGMTNPETITRTYAISDYCGRTITCTQDIIVNASSSVSVNCPSGYSVNCKADISINPNDASVTGACAGSSVVFSTVGPTLISGTDECPGAIYEIQYNATVDGVAAASCTQLVSLDPVVLTINCPANQTLACSATLPSPNTALVSATSNCPSENPVTKSFVSDADNGGSGCPGDPRIVIRTYRVTDACGNTADCTQTFTFTPNTPPTIACTAPNETVNCIDDINPSAADVTVTSTCNLVANVIIGAPILSGGSDGCNGASYAVTYSVTDECGQTATCNRTYTLSVSGPVIASCPLPLEMECDGDYAAEIDNWLLLASSGATLDASSDCDQDLTITANYTGATAAAALTCDSAPLVVTFTVTDECGQSATCASSITATDSGGPVITQCASDLILECDGNYTSEINTWLNNAVSGTTLIATDAGDPNLTITSDYTPGSLPIMDCNGLTGLIVTFTVTDDAGNSVTCTADIIIIDTTDPVISSCPSDLNLVCDGDYTSEINAWLNAATAGTSLVATDACDNSLTLSHNYTGAIPATECDAASATGLTVTFFAEDDCGNVSSCTATLSITDEVAPSITCPASTLSLAACDPTNESQILTWLSTTSATDGCDGDIVYDSKYRWTRLQSCCKLYGADRR